MEVHDALGLIISSGSMLIALLTLIISIVKAISQDKKK